jgi:signal recognition particle receptor subunit beta
MYNPRTWIAIVQILLHKLCCWWTVDRPIEWRCVRVACLGLDGASEQANTAPSARINRGRSPRAWPLPPSRQPHRRFHCYAAGAGKTSVSSCIEGKPSIDQQPTAGFNCRNARIKPYWQLDMWDLGGAEGIRQYWARYLTPDTVLVIFVVDASDRARLAEARSALTTAMAAAPSTTLLVLANKQDLEGAASPTELAEALGVVTSTRPPRCTVLPVSCARALEDGSGSSGIATVNAWIAAELEAEWTSEPT